MEIRKEVYNFLKEFSLIINDGQHTKIGTRLNEFKVLSATEMEQLFLKHKDLHPSIKYSGIHDKNIGYQLSLIENYSRDANIYKYLSFQNDDLYSFIGLSQDGGLAIENYEKEIDEEKATSESLDNSKKVIEISKEANKKAKIANTISIIALVTSFLISIIGIIISIFLKSN